MYVQLQIEPLVLAYCHLLNEIILNHFGHVSNFYFLGADLALAFRIFSLHNHFFLTLKDTDCFLYAVDEIIEVLYNIMNNVLVLVHDFEAFVHLICIYECFLHQVCETTLLLESCIGFVDEVDDLFGPFSAGDDDDVVVHEI